MLLIFPGLNFRNLKTRKKVFAKINKAKCETVIQWTSSEGRHTQRSNIGQGRRNQFWAPALQFPGLNFQGNDDDKTHCLVK